MATTLRDLGLEQRSAAAPAPTLRDFGLTPQAAPDVSQIVDETAANGMGQLRRGYTSGVYGGDANLLAAEQSSLRAAGKHTEADALGQRIAALNNRAATFAPAEQDVTKLGWNPGRILDYGLGAVGQAGASMQDPIAMGVAGNAASNLVSMIPHPAARAVGLGLRGAGMLGGYYDMARQAKGEFYQDALKDPELMAKTSAQDLNDKGNVFGALSGAVDTALPGMIAGRLSGRGVKALSKLGAPAKLAVDAGIEDGQELSQEAGKKFALGQLNPNRDTSGDANDYWNSAAGGAFGGAGIGGSAHLVSHLASSAVNRKGVVDDTSSNDVSGKAVPPKNESLVQSMARAAKENTSGAQEKWHNALMGVPDENNLDDIDTPINTQHAALTKELTARAAKGDATAQQHLDALSAMQPGSADWYDEGPRSAAATHIMGDGQDHSKFEKAYKERARNMQGFQTVNVGNEEVAVGAPIAPGELGKGKEGGVKIERDSPEMKAAVQERRDVKQRAVLTGRIMSDAVPADAKPQLKKVAASLGAEIAEFAGSGYQKPLPGDVARVQRMAAQMVYLYGGVKAAEIVKKVAATSGAQGTPLMQAMTASVAAARDTHIFAKQQRVARDTAAQQLVQAIPPRAQLTLHRAGLDLTTEEGRAALLTHVEDFFDGESTRSAMAFNTTFGKHTVEAMRQIVGQRLEPRIEPMKEAASKAADTAESTSPTESDEVGSKTKDEADAEEDADWENKNARENAERTPGSREYFFNKLKHPVPGTDAKTNPFASNVETGNLPSLATAEQTDASSGEHTLTRLMNQAQKRISGGETDGMEVVESKRQPGRHPKLPLDRGIGSTRVRAVSAKEVMDHHNISERRRVETMAEYLGRPDEDGVVVDPHLFGRIRNVDRMIHNATKTTDAPTREQLNPRTGKMETVPATAGTVQLKSGGAAASALDGHEDSGTYKGLLHMRKERLALIRELGDHVGMKTDASTTLLEVANHYFASRYLVEAGQEDGKDSMVLQRAEVTRMIRLGERYLNRAQKEGENRVETEAGMNLIRFDSPLSVKRDGKAAAIPVQALVNWVWENSTDFGKRDYNSPDAAAKAYRQALSEGLAALLSTGAVEGGLPYMINREGQVEVFSPKGLPPSLKLSTLTEGMLTDEAKRRALKALEKQGPLIENSGNMDKEGLAEEQSREMPDRNTNPDELVDEGQLAPNIPSVKRNERFVGPREENDVRDDATQYWDAPAAEPRLASTPENPGIDERGFVGPAGEERRESRAGRYPVAPETVSTRTDDEHRTQLDSEYAQTSGVPTDRTDLRNRNEIKRAAADKIEGVTSTNAMARAPGIANQILYMFSQFKGDVMVKGRPQYVEGAQTADPRGAIQRIQRLVNALTASEYVKVDSGKTVGGKQYAAPLAYILTPRNVAFILSQSNDVAKATKLLEMMRSQTANALTKATDEFTSAERTALARLLTGDPKLSAVGRSVNTALEKLSWPARTAAKAARVARETQTQAQDEKTAQVAAKREAKPLAAKVEAAPKVEAAVAAPKVDASKQAEWVAAKLATSIGTFTAAIKGFTGEQLLALGDVMNGLPPAGTSLMRWRNARQVVEDKIYDGVTAEQVIAHEAKTSGASERSLNTQATPADIQSPEAASPSDDRIAAAKAYIAKVLGPKVTAQFVKDFDAAGEWIKAENLIKLSLTGGPGMMDVAHHEAMHAFFDGLLEHHPKAAEALKNVLGGEAIYERLKGLLANEPTALEQIKNDPAERVAYAFQFWAAGALDVDKPATTMFDKFRKFLRKVLGMVRESETALDIITAFHAGKAADLGNAESPAGRVIKEILARETWNEDVKRKFDTVVQKLHAAVAPSNDVLRREVMSATARELGLMMFTNPGEQAAGGAKEGYINARARIGRQFSNRLYQVLKGLSDRDMLAAIEMLQNGQKPDEATYAPVGAAVKGVYGLLQRYREHALNAGLNLENLGDNYFPRIWDLSKLIEGDGKDQFIAMLMKPEYDEKLATMMAVINANRDVAYTKEEVVSAMHRSLVDRGGVDEQGMEAEAEHDDLILKPFFASSKERHFKWLNREDVTPFLEKDLVGAMSRYLHQGVRAAEFARRFGDGGGKLKAMLKMKGDQVPGPDGQMVDAAEHGPIAAEMEEHLKEKGIEGAEADKIIATHMGNIKQAVAAHEGSIGGDISPGFRKLSSAAMAYQNMRLLPMALFSAVADTAALAARGPGLKGAYEAFVKGLTDVYARWKDAASDTPAVRKNSLWDDIAETVGAVDSHMFLEQMGKAHTSEFMTNFARNANRKLFMLNGLTAWDRSMRVSATKFAVQFLEAHKSLPDAQHSARWLKELGLKPADIHLDGEGKLIWNRNVLQAETGMSQDEATKAMEKTHYAITRWVEGAVLSPNAAQRPSWGSDPRWAVLFHLKQFTYSMQHTVLKRAFNEASEGNMNPIGALAAGIPIMMASDIVKGLVQGGGSLPTWQHGMDLGDRVKMAAQRAGLAGVGQFGIDALHDPAGIFGPTVGQIWKTATNPSDLGSNLIDAVPGLRYVKPAKDLVLGAE